MAGSESWAHGPRTPQNLRRHHLLVKEQWLGTGRGRTFQTEGPGGPEAPGQGHPCGGSDRSATRGICPGPREPAGLVVARCVGQAGRQRGREAAHPGFMRKEEPGLGAGCTRSQEPALLGLFWRLLGGQMETRVTRPRRSPGPGFPGGHRKPLPPLLPPLPQASFGPRLGAGAGGCWAAA